MFGPKQTVKVKATGQVGTVVAYYPDDDEYRVIFADGSSDYVYDGDLTLP